MEHAACDAYRAGHLHIALIIEQTRLDALEDRLSVLDANLLSLNCNRVAGMKLRVFPASSRCFRVVRGPIRIAVRVVAPLLMILRTDLYAIVIAIRIIAGVVIPRTAIADQALIESFE